MRMLGISYFVTLSSSGNVYSNVVLCGPPCLVYHPDTFALAGGRNPTGERKPPRRAAARRAGSRLRDTGALVF